jgi:type IV secretory pathway protease TraF
MRIVKMIVISTLTSAVSLAAVASPAEDTRVEEAASEAIHMMRSQQGGMPMMQGQQGGMPMMQQRHTMMQEHMKTMETHMANIEALLKQLVELQKK